MLVVVVVELCGGGERELRSLKEEIEALGARILQFSSSSDLRCFAFLPVTLFLLVYLFDYSSVTE